MLGAEAISAQRKIIIICMLVPWI